MGYESKSVVLGTRGAVGLAATGTASPITGIDAAAKQAVIDAFDLVGDTFGSGGSEHTAIGYTAVEQNITLTPNVEEGGTFGSWQQDGLRVAEDSVTWSIQVPALQLIDNDILTLVFGGGDTTSPGEFGIPKTRTPQERALLLIIADPVTRSAMHFPKVTARARQAEEFGRGALTVAQLDFQITDLSTAAQLGSIYNELLGS